VPVWHRRVIATLARRLPPWDEAFGELAIFAARSFDMPLSLSASYCSSFVTFADVDSSVHLLVRPVRFP
jgi:hypothetical protein